MTRGRWVLVLVAVGAVALVAVMLWWQRDDLGVSVLATPQPGQAMALILSDGHPVWAVGHEDGSISVLDAFSTHVPYGINKLTWWCGESRVIDDPFHGSRYNELGDKIDGPAPTGLREYSGRIEDGQLHIDGGPVPRPLADPRTSGEQPYYCTRGEASVHDLVTIPEAASPAIAAGADEGRWRRVHGTLVPQPERGSGLLCPDAVADDDCAEIALPGMEHYVPGPEDPFSVDNWTDVDWLVRAEGGRIVEIALVIPNR